MELKDYQQHVIDNLNDYLDTLTKYPDLKIAFKTYWQKKGLKDIEPYKNNVPNVPHVCAKVPTAGGKTFIAVNAIKTIFDAISIPSPKCTKLVIWLVPSLTILEQTVKNLENCEHPYRRRLNQLFQNRVAIYEKHDLLMNAGFSAESITEQLSIVIMSFDSLRARNKEDRKIYQDNGYLASFANNLNTDSILPEYDASALINVIRQLKPIVIVDESHNAETSLSVEMLKNLNPQFIFDLTATPKNNSNIISYVDAMALKKQHMVKLPVIVANAMQRHEAIENALNLRQKLEAIALEQETQSGKYIRPIILFQAESKTNDDKITFEKIKQQLIELGIPDAEIKIKTANINELKGVDLMSRDCPVRYIITVNALKEGWDCPYAYILVSLADKSSAVDVEQLLGRILRMPHVQQHGHDLLNMSYVFTASNQFMATLQNIVKALNKAGFSDKDYREFIPKIETESNKPSYKETLDIFTQNNTELFTEKPSSIQYAEIVSSSNDFVRELTTQATIQNQQYESQAAKITNVDIPVELADKMNKHKLKDLFKEQALLLKLPQFFINTEQGGWIEEDSAQLFEKDFLLKDFVLSKADAQISFEDIETEMYRVDLQEIGEENYQATPFKINAKTREKFNELILKNNRESQLKDLIARLTQLIGNMYPIADQEIKKYVTRIVETFNQEQIKDCLERDVSYTRKIKQKINTLADSHAHKTFIDYLDLDKIWLQPHFSFSEIITPSNNAPILPKSLYVTEAAIGQFEARVINDIANLNNIEWWHRNLSRGKGFKINGFLNHYPDFIIKTKSEKIIIIETKGDDRDNSDSELKLKLGKLWEAKAGQNFKYMMVFDNNPISGAERLADALRKLEQW